MLLGHAFVSALAGLIVALDAVAVVSQSGILGPAFVIGPLGLMVGGSAGLAGFFACEAGFNRLARRQ